MPEVSMSVRLNASADEVWGLIGGFNALPDWHPAAAKSTLEEDGKVRRLEVVGGAVVRERLERHSDSERACTYTIDAGPIPVSGYRATLRVREEGAGCVVEWSSEFTPAGVPEEEAAGIIRGIYQGGFDALSERFGAA